MTTTDLPNPSLPFLSEDDILATKHFINKATHEKNIYMTWVDVFFLQADANGEATDDLHEVIDFLHRLSSQDVKSLHHLGAKVETLLCTSQGKMIAWLTVLRTQKALLCMTHRGSASAVVAWLEKHIIMENIVCEIMQEPFIWLHATGDHMEILLQHLPVTFYPPISSVAMLKKSSCYASFLPKASDPQDPWFWWCFVQSKDVVSLQQSWFQGLCSEKQLPALRDVLLGLNVVLEEDPQAYENFRLQQGIPSAFYEYSQNNQPFEVALDRAIGWNKGCYIGQEVISRLHSYHKIKRRLVQCLIPLPQPNKQIEAIMALPEAERATAWKNLKIYDGDQWLGHLTSAVWLQWPKEDGFVQKALLALALVKTPTLSAMNSGRLFSLKLEQAGLLTNIGDHLSLWQAPFFPYNPEV